jgi:hypothetical protein
MKNSIVFSTLLFFIGVLFFSCAGKSAIEEKCENWSASEEFQDELNAITTAATNYGQNPTKENCEAYKEAYLDYIDALRDFEDCYTFYDLDEEFSQLLDESEASVNNIDCN